MKKRIKSFYDFVTINFWFLLFVIITILFYMIFCINRYGLRGGNNVNTYKSIVAELTKNAENIELPDDFEVEIIISDTSAFGCSDVLKAKMHDGELILDYERRFWADIFDPLITCLLVSLFITIILYAVSCFIVFIIRCFRRNN